jgi:ubiquinone/menaquinone biosynthesis C-methylase UbiE/uncharacterized protein YbaR (Trm112 family)
MSDEEKVIAFNRRKIYGKLSYPPQPADYSSHIPWVVQQRIATTNGLQYESVLGKLKEYPVYNMPVTAVSQGIMLDIGFGWGRWLVAGANKGYIPVGIDIRLEYCSIARSVLDDFGKQGYTLVADLENLPFKNNVFDLVWSFGVIQHTHYKRMVNCLQHIDRIMLNEGYTHLEFPNKNGIRNRFGPAIEGEKYKDDYNSWFVRYYTVKEYLQLLNTYLSDISYRNHSFLGIGVLPEDLKYVSPRNKILCAVSLLGSAMTNIIPGLKNLSDSLYFKAHKKNKLQNDVNAVAKFLELHYQNPGDNLNIHPLLRCPKYGGGITISKDRKRAVSEEAGVYYPIENDTPIMVVSEANIL